MSAGFAFAAAGIMTSGILNGKEILIIIGVFMVLVVLVSEAN